MRLFEFANMGARFAQRSRIAQASNDAGKRSLLTCIGGKHYRVTSGDQYRDHANGAFEPGIAALIASLLRGGDRVLDVGAGSGGAAALFTRHAGFDFIKIDVENFERHGIDALAPAIIRWRPLVLLDLNHWNLDQCQRTSVPDFLACLRGLFPLLAAVDGANLRDLHDADGACQVMYRHLVNHARYPALVGAFERARLPPGAGE